jgi:hypothetical protein
VRERRKGRRKGVREEEKEMEEKEEGNFAAVWCGGVVKRDLAGGWGLCCFVENSGLIYGICVSSGSFFLLPTQIQREGWVDSARGVGGERGGGFLEGASLRSSQEIEIEAGRTSGIHVVQSFYRARSLTDSYRQKTHLSEKAKTCNT